MDEAHCIAEWGHDFRPSYRTLLAARYRLGRPPAVALTGSATPAVRDDIARALGFAAGKFAEHLGSFDRANLWFGVVRVADERDRLQALRRLLSGDDRMAIVYAPTRSVTEGVARALAAAGHRAAPYHAGLDRARRAAILDAFLADRIDVVVATCAFGMGIDKPTVRLVVHWTLPPTPESYYQEAGRAGRDGEFARCVLLWHPRRRRAASPPARRHLSTAAHCSSGSGSIRKGTAAFRRTCGNPPSGSRRELRPDLGPVDWEPVRQRRRRAEDRLRAMEQYADGDGCRRRALVGYFGETLAACSGLRPLPTEPRRTPAHRRRVAARLARLRQALGGKAGPWGGCLLEPERPAPAGAESATRRGRAGRRRRASVPRSPSATGPRFWERSAWMGDPARGVDAAERGGAGAGGMAGGGGAGDGRPGLRRARRSGAGAARGGRCAGGAGAVSESGPGSAPSSRRSCGACCSGSAGPAATSPSTPAR